MAEAMDVAASTTVPWLTDARVVTPTDTAGAAEALREAAQEGAIVVPRGNGTKLDWGGTPRGCDLLLDTTALTGVDHAAGDLVVRVGAGTTMAELRRELAARGQRLSLDVPVADSTVGGVVATGLSGPSRLLYGAVRDLVIGMTVVRADGRVTRSGGTVVKNVAGYDLGKLHTGALGTLGVITSVTFRLHPVPAVWRVVHARSPHPDIAAGWLRRVRDSQAVPTAVEIDAERDGPIAVQVLLEGAAGGIESRAREVTDLLDGGRVDTEPPKGWAHFPGQAGDTLLKIAVPVAETLTAVTALRESASAVELPVHLRGSAGTGVLYAALPASADPAAVREVVTRLRTAVTGMGRGEPPTGAVTVPRPAEPARPGLDLWGEVPGLALMRAIKNRFDPDHRLSPGRFAGGI